MRPLGRPALAVRSPPYRAAVLCQLTGHPHRAFWMRSAWWCADCRQKLETCCEGNCPSVLAETPVVVPAETPADPRGRTPLRTGLS